MHCTNVPAINSRRSMTLNQHLEQIKSELVQPETYTGLSNLESLPRSSVKPSFVQKTSDYLRTARLTEQNKERKKERATHWCAYHRKTTNTFVWARTKNPKHSNNKQSKLKVSYLLLKSWKIVENLERGDKQRQTEQIAEQVRCSRL